jgi:4-amino-4-deoxy-L-arabinose transferase-like glycosyltransferase
MDLEKKDSRVIGIIMMTAGTALMALALIGSGGLDLVLRAVVVRPANLSVNHGPLYWPMATGLAVMAGATGLFLYRRARRAVWFQTLFPERAAAAIILVQAVLLIPLKNGAMAPAVFVILMAVGFLLLAAVIPAGEPGPRWRGAMRRAAGLSSGRFQVLLAAASLALGLLVALGLYGQTPHVLDEGVYLFQARIFAHGRLFAPPPGPAEFFYLPNLIQTDRIWVSHHPPGWPALLALGARFGLAWLVNPLLGALTALLAYRLGRAAADECTGRIAGALSLLSPYVIFMNGSLMAHPGATLLLTLALLAALHWQPTASLSWAMVLGFGLGAAAAIRPYSAFLYGLPLAGLVAYYWVREPRRRSWSVLALVAVMAVPVVLMLGFNQKTFGSPFTFGYQLTHGGASLLGFGQRFYPEGYTMGEALRVLGLRLTTLSRLLWALPLPPFLFILLPVLIDKGRSRLLFLAAPAGAVIFGHLFFYFIEESFPARFAFEVWPALIVLAARGITLIRERMERLPVAAQGRWQRAAALAVLIAGLINLPGHAPFYLATEEGGPALKRAMARVSEANPLVLVQPLSYLMGVSLMDPVRLEAGPIFVRDLGPEKNQTMIQRCPGRKVYCFVSHPPGDFELFPCPSGDQSKPGP